MDFFQASVNITQTSPKVRAVFIGNARLKYIYIYIYIYKFRYTPMITSQNSVQNVSVATDEGPGSKLALSEGGSRGNIES